jgi:hypothetical protein
MYTHVDLKEESTDSPSLKTPSAHGSDVKPYFSAPTLVTM